MNLAVKSKLHSLTKAGFALVATLLFIFLIIGLLVTLMSLTTVELRVVENSTKLRKARNNALTGLHQAINTLQNNAGLDQSITATAALLDTNPMTQKIDGVANPWLTGVWRYSDTPLNPDKPLVWLISGAQEQDDTNTPLATPFTKLDNPTSKKDYVWLLHKAVGEDLDLSVKARKIEIKIKKPTRSSEPDKKYTIGHYAWWASDESTKCRVNLPMGAEEKASKSETVMQAKWKLSAPRRASWKMTDMEALPVDSVNLSKVLTFAQISLLVAPTNRNKLLDSLEKHFHDLTADSLGVITDTKAGGLKFDLSLAFEMTDDAFENDPYFTQNDELIDLMPTMRDHYRAYKRVENPHSNPSFDACPNAIKSLDNTKEGLAEASNSYLNSKDALPVKAGFNPIVMRFEYCYSVLSNSAPTKEVGGPDQKLLLVLDPIITLWNPHNITLKFDSYRVNAWVPSLHLVIEKRDPWKADRKYVIDDEVWHNEQLYRAKTPIISLEPSSKTKEWELLNRKWTLASDISLKKLFENYSAGKTSSFIMLNKGSSLNSPIEMKPGEIVIFSPDQNKPYTHQPGDFHLILERGLNTQGGISFERLTPQQNGGETGNDMLLHVYNDSEIRVTLEPERDDDYKKNDPFGFVASHTVSGFDATPISDTAPQPYREFIGYFKDGANAFESFAWAGNRTGEAPKFTYSTRAYSGKDKTDKPLPGMSDTLKVGKQINDKEKRFLGLIDWHLKTEADANGFPVQMITRFDPRCVFMRQPKRGYPCTIPQYQISARKLTSSTGIIEVNKDNGYWGPSNGASGESFASLFEIPTVPMLSIGQLQHYHAGSRARSESINAGYIIGSSWAHPYIKRDMEEEPTAENGPIKDLSHLLNRKLFDHFYFSSITPRTGEETVNGRITDLTAESNPKSLPNPRMRLYLAPGQTLKSVCDSLTDIPDPSKTPSYKKAAANFFVEGAFNINSTSVEAWKTLLASLNGFAIPVCDSLDNTTTLIASKDTPLPRFILSNGDDSKQWRGFRSLTDKQLQALAEAIVNEVKIRGPFSSLGDFINRRLKIDDTGLKGALQAAIDSTDINHNFTALITGEQLKNAAQKGNSNSGAEDWSFPYPEHCTGPIGAGAAGFLTQGDLLQALAPHLTARSDTFKIRAYGDVVNPITGKLEARAWCEAIVQRLPEYTNYVNKDDPPEEWKADAPWVQPENQQNQYNVIYGRRFRIVRIRWLSPDEV